MKILALLSAVLLAPAPAPAPVVDAHGFGPLKLGMSQQQALATGLISPFEAARGEAGCVTARFKDNRGDGETYAMFSRKLGIAAIQGPLGTRTPEGIGAGATSAELIRAYPGVKQVDLDNYGRAEVTPAANPRARYRIEIGQDKKVAHVAVQFADQDCYE